MIFRRGLVRGTQSARKTSTVLSFYRYSHQVPHQQYFEMHFVFCPWYFSLPAKRLFLEYLLLWFSFVRGTLVCPQNLYYISFFQQLFSDVMLYLQHRFTRTTGHSHSERYWAFYLIRRRLFEVPFGVYRRIPTLSSQCLQLLEIPQVLLSHLACGYPSAAAGGCCTAHCLFAAKVDAKLSFNV